MQGQDLCASFEADPGELQRLEHLLETFGAENGLSQKLLFELDLVLEEVLTNIIKYGCAAQSSCLINLKISCSPAALTVLVEDEGIPFNPLQAPKPDLEAPPEERELGGVGVHLVLSLMDEVTYQRSGSRNFLKMSKRIHS